MARTYAVNLQGPRVRFEGVEPEPYRKAQSSDIHLCTPKETYLITITGYEFKATETVTLTEEGLEDFVDGLLKDGYSHQPTTITRVIYPAHVICKIKVERHKDQNKTD